jgi:hypothetical protein
MRQRDLTHPPQKRCHGQALDENGEESNHERNRDHRVSMRNVRRQSQCQCESEGSPKTSPKQNVLMPTGNTEGKPMKDRTTRIDGQRSPQCHNQNGYTRRYQTSCETLACKKYSNVHKN